MDWRIIAVFTPIVLAISWAVFNIGRAALGQLQLAVKDFKKNQSWSAWCLFFLQVFNFCFMSLLLKIFFRLFASVSIGFLLMMGWVIVFLFLLFWQVFTVVIFSIGFLLTGVMIYWFVKSSANRRFGIDLTGLHLLVLILFWIKEWIRYLVLTFHKLLMGS